MRHFVDHFVAGTTPLETFEDGVIVNHIIDACYRSMRTGVWEKIKTDG
jgi:predicted dehydrogenase